MKVSLHHKALMKMKNHLKFMYKFKLQKQYFTDETIDAEANLVF